MKSFAMIACVERSFRPPIALTFLALICLAPIGCIARPVKEKVWSDGYTEVFLRSHKSGNTTVAKGFQHPASIAAVRLAHVLSRIDMRKEIDGESKRIPAIPLDTLFTIGEAVSEGLEKANPDQEIVVQSIRRGRHLTVFERQYLTSLLAYVQGDLLYIQLSRSDWEIPPRKKERLPETHLGKHALEFRLIADKGMTLVGEQTVAVEWRDPIFKKPTRTRITAGGRVVRREILMESVVDDTVEAPRVEDLNAAQLRALADLDDERRSGAISESEYYSRKNAILRGELPAP